MERQSCPDSDSLENGVILLYNQMRSHVSSEKNLLLEECDIDAIFRGSGGEHNPAVIQMVEFQAQEFVNDLLRNMRERMLDLHSDKVVFVGGDSILLRRQIEFSGKIGEALFIEDICANAKGYEFLYKLEIEGR